MRVITAIYLHCRPELRDEWLSGMHEAGNVGGYGMGGGFGTGGGGGMGEGEVEDSVPLEWALRGLTFWWQKRRYGDVMKTVLKDGEGKEEMEGVVEDEEKDFFQKELDQLGWGLAELGLRGGDEEVAFGEEASGVQQSNGQGRDGGVNGGGRDQGWEDANAATLEAWQNSR